MTRTVRPATVLSAAALLLFAILLLAVLLFTGCSSKSAGSNRPAQQTAGQDSGRPGSVNPPAGDKLSNGTPSPGSGNTGSSTTPPPSDTPDGSQLPGSVEPGGGNDAGPAQPPPSGDAGLPPSEQDRTVYSWWFKRTGGGKSPAFDPAAAAMVRGKGYYLGDTSKKTVYLTFDEGYENGFTPKILDVLKETNTPAAFFVTADFVRTQPELVKRMAADGHIIGNHTATHPSLPALTNAEIRKELDITGSLVSKLTGITMRYMRPPMGEYNARVLDETDREGYKAVFWSIAYKDWDVNNQPGAPAAFREVMDNLHPGAVILLHAVSESNTQALDDIIKAVKARGYKFASLDEL